MSEGGHVVVLDHPLIQHRIRWLRDERTTNADFLRLAGELSRFVAYEAFREASLVDTVVDTPVAKGARAAVVDAEYLVVPILRAGLGMLPSVTEVLPRTRVCLVGLRRDEATLEPQLYLDGLPDSVGGDEAVVCDPMLATGGSAIRVVDLLESRGAGGVTVLCLMAAAPGVQCLLDRHPRVRVVTAALDPSLDDRGFIVPGLGDAGDRLFGPALR